MLVYPLCLLYLLTDRDLLAYLCDCVLVRCLLIASFASSFATCLIAYFNHIVVLLFVLCLIFVACLLAASFLFVCLLLVCYLLVVARLLLATRSIACCFWVTRCFFVCFGTLKIRAKMIELLVIGFFQS